MDNEVTPSDYVEVESDTQESIGLEEEQENTEEENVAPEEWQENTEEEEALVEELSDSPTSATDSKVNPIFFMLNAETASIPGLGPGNFRYALGESLCLWGEKKKFHQGKVRLTSRLTRMLARKRFTFVPFLQALEEIALCAPPSVCKYCEFEVQARLVYFLPLVKSLLLVNQAEILHQTRRFPRLRPDVWKKVVRLILLHTGDARERLRFLNAALSADPEFPRALVRITNDLANTVSVPDSAGGQYFYKTDIATAIELLQLFSNTFTHYSVPQYRAAKVLEHMADFIELDGADSSQEWLGLVKPLISQGKLNMRVSFGK